MIVSIKCYKKPFKHCVDSVYSDREMVGDSFCGSVVKEVITTRTSRLDQVTGEMKVSN